MAAFDFPLIHPAQAHARLVTTGALQRGTFGGASKRLVRSGLHALDLAFPPMAKDDAARVIGALLKSHAEGAPIRMRWPQPLDPVVSQSGLVAGAGQGGRLLNIDGVPTPNGQKANLLRYSQALDNAAWNKSGASITETAGLSPDGTFTADKLSEDTSTGAHYAAQQVTGATAITYTFQAYLAAHGRTKAVLQMDDTSNAASVGCDLTTGQIAVAFGAPAALRSDYIGDLGDGLIWWRFSFLWTPILSNLICTVLLSDGVGTSYTGVAGNGVFVWGAQANPGLTPSRPVRTAGVAAWSVIEAGRGLSLEIAGRTYLYVVTDDVAVPATGVCTLPLDCALRATPPDNAAINFDSPVIEGFPEGDPAAWTLDRVMATGLDFTLVEAR